MPEGTKEFPGTLAKMQILFQQVWDGWEAVVQTAPE